MMYYFILQMKKSVKIRTEEKKVLTMGVVVAMLMLNLLMGVPDADAADLEEKLSKLEPHPLYRSLHQEHRRVLTLGDADALPNDVPLAGDYTDMDPADLIPYGDAVTVS